MRKNIHGYYDKKRNFIDHLEYRIIRPYSNKLIYLICKLLGGHNRFSVIVHSHNILGEWGETVHHTCWYCHHTIYEKYDKEKYLELPQKTRNY